MTVPPPGPPPNKGSWSPKGSGGSKQGNGNKSTKSQPPAPSKPFKTPKVSMAGVKGIGSFLAQHRRVWLYAILLVVALVGSSVLIKMFEFGEFLVLGLLIVAIFWSFKKPTFLKKWWSKLSRKLKLLVGIGLAIWAGFAFWATMLRTLDSSSGLAVFIAAVGFMVAAFRIWQLSELKVPSAAGPSVELKLATWGTRFMGLATALAFVGVAYLLNNPSLVDRLNTKDTPAFVHYQHQAEVNANRDGRESYTERVRIKGDCSSVNIVEGLKTGSRPSVKLEMKENKCFVSIRINDGPARIYAGKNTNILNHETSDDGIWTILEIDTPNTVDIMVFRYVFKPGEQKNPRIPPEYLKLKPALIVHSTGVKD